MARAGRRPGPTTTPDAILDAARTLFAERGFQATTVRAVAAAAGVNVALVHHYFGTKDELLVAALELPINPMELIAGLVAAGPRDEVGERLVRTFIRIWREPATGQRMQALLRNAAGTAEGAVLVRNMVEKLLLDRLATALDVPRLRVAVAMSHLVGLAFAAMIVGVEPLASASEDELVALIAPTVNRYLAS